MPADAIPVLFVSRRDSLRSVLATACMQHVGHGRFAAYSCGIPGEVADETDPAALEALAQAHIGARPHLPHAWDSFRRAGAPSMRFLIVLDQHAAARLDTWPRQPDVAVWAYPDLLADGTPPPDKVKGILLSLRRRLEIFANLPMRHGNREALRQDVQDLGHL
jgi:protein-tyrosine-phosphatase